MTTLIFFSHSHIIAKCFLSSFTPKRVINMALRLAIPKLLYRFKTPLVGFVAILKWTVRIAVFALPALTLRLIFYFLVS